MTDYLWDKGGDVDPEIDRLEGALRPFAQTTPPPPLVLAPRPAMSTSSRWLGVALLAASLVLVVGGLTLAFRFRPAQPSWQVTTAAGQSSLPVGGWLETGSGSVRRSTSRTSGQ